MFVKSVRVCIDGKEEHLEMQEIDKGDRDTYIGNLGNQ